MRKIRRILSALLLTLQSSVLCADNPVNSGGEDVLAVVVLKEISPISEESENDQPRFYNLYLGSYEIVRVLNGGYDLPNMQVRIYWHYDGPPDVVGNRSIAKFEWSERLDAFTINGMALTFITPLKDGSYGVCDPNKGRYVMYDKYKILHPLDVMEGFDCEYGMPLDAYIKDYWREFYPVR